MISTLLLAAAAATFSPQAPTLGDLSRTYVDATNALSLTIEQANGGTAVSKLAVIIPTGGHTLFFDGTSTIQTLNGLHYLITSNTFGVPFMWNQIIVTTDIDNNDRYRLPGVSVNDPYLGEVQDPDCKRAHGVWVGWVRVNQPGNGTPYGGGCPVSSGQSPPSSPTGGSVPVYPGSGQPPAAPQVPTAPGVAGIAIGSPVFNPAPTPAGGQIRYPSETGLPPFQGEADVSQITVKIREASNVSADGGCRNNAVNYECAGAVVYQILVTGPGTGAGIGNESQTVLPAPNVQPAGPGGIPNSGPPPTPYPVSAGPTMFPGGSFVPPGTAPGDVTENEDGTVTRKYYVKLPFNGCGVRDHTSYEVFGNMSDKTANGTGEPFTIPGGLIGLPHYRLILTFWSQCNSCEK